MLDFFIGFFLIGVLTSLGRLLLRAFEPLNMDSIAEMVLSFCLGLVLVSCGVLILLLLTPLNRMNALIMWLVWIALSSLEWRRVFQRGLTVARNIQKVLWVPGNVWKKVALGAILLNLAILALECRVPEVAWDSLTLHLKAPKLLASGIDLNALNDSYCYFPLGLHLIFALEKVFFSDTVVKLTCWGISLALLGGIYGFCKAHFPAGTALLGVVTLFACPMFVKYFNVSYVDLALSLFFLQSLTMVFLYRKDPQYRWLFLAALLAAFLGAIKIQGLLFMSLVFLVWGAFEWELKSPWSRRIQAVAIFSLLVGMVSGPWYLRSYLVTGDPLIGAGKGGPLPSARPAGWRPLSSQAKSPFSRFVGRHPGRKDMEIAGEQKSQASRGRTGEWYGLLLLPWDLTFHGEWWLGAWIGPAFLMFLPLVLLYKLHQLPRSIRLMLTIAVATLVAWFLVLRHVNIRYLFPILPLLAICVGYLIRQLDTVGLLSLRRIATRFLVGIFLMNTLGFLGFHTMAVFLGGKARGRPNDFLVAIGLADRKDYLRRCWEDDFMEAIEFVNENLPPGSLLFTNEARNYYLNVPWISRSFIHPLMWGNYRNEADVIHKLRSLGITHVMINATFDLNFYGENGKKLEIKGPTFYGKYPVVAQFGENIWLYDIRSEETVVRPNNRANCRRGSTMG